MRGDSITPDSTARQPITTSKHLLTEEEVFIASVLTDFLRKLPK